jgi:hypothetical protein
MNVHLLIDGLVRQTTVLIAELATSGGVRAPLAHVANQVFLDLAAELERQGVSRKVSADMFGLALRSYQRKIARLRESSTERGRSLWAAVYDFLAGREVTTRSEVLRHFRPDGEELVGSVLHDLAENGFVFASGRGAGTAYRVVTSDELERLASENEPNVDAMVWTIVYREGPIAESDLVRRTLVSGEALAASLKRLQDARHVTLREEQGARIWASSELVIAVDADAGWEAAVLDHFQALVRTIVAKLRSNGNREAASLVGGSTYTFVVWPEHPHYDEVCRELADFRARRSELRARVDAHNDTHGIPPHHRKVISYFGQCVISEAELEGDHVA